MISLLEEAYLISSGKRKIVSLRDLINLIKHGLLYLDFTNKIEVDIELSNGCVVRNVMLPLDLSDPRSRMDALRLIKAMERNLKSLSQDELWIYRMLKSRLRYAVVYDADNDEYINSKITRDKDKKEKENEFIEILL